MPFIHYLWEYQLKFMLVSTQSSPGRKIYLRNQIKVRRLSVKYGSWTNQVGCFERLYSLNSLFSLQGHTVPAGQMIYYSARQGRPVLEKHWQIFTSSLSFFLELGHWFSKGGLKATYSKYSSGIYWKYIFPGPILHFEIRIYVLGLGILN